MDYNSSDREGWYRFNVLNMNLYNAFAKENKLLVKFENGIECNYNDVHPWSKLTHFKKDKS